MDYTAEIIGISRERVYHILTKTLYDKNFVQGGRRIWSCYTFERPLRDHLESSYGHVFRVPNKSLKIKFLKNSKSLCMAFIR